MCASPIGISPHSYVEFFRALSLWGRKNLPMKNVNTGNDSAISAKIPIGMYSCPSTYTLLPIPIKRVRANVQKKSEINAKIITTHPFMVKPQER